MEKNTLLIGAVLLTIGLGVGYTLRGGQPTWPAIGQHMMGNGSMMAQNIDQHFIVQMIPHHDGAIEMAKVALERSKRPEMLSLANGIIEAQTREIKDMKSWYQSWFGSTPPAGGFGMMGGGIAGGMTGDTDKLARVSDAEFDREFIEQMVPHHEMAVMMAGMLQATTDRAEMKTLADEKSLTFTCEIPGIKVRVKGDAEKLRQVIQNFLDNSIKYTEKGWVKIKLEVKGPKVQVSVSDSGLGIHKDILPTLFEQFNRGSTEAKKIQGTGLGLYIAKQFMEAHHGRVWAESRGPGLGSVFTMEMDVLE